MKKKVHELFSERKTRKVTPSNSLPIFIPICARHAFFYRTASLLSFEEFKKFDKELIEDIGKLEDGKYKWKKRTQAEKYRMVYDVVSKNSDYEERLEAANFKPFLEAVQDYICDEQNQLQFIHKQLDIALDQLSQGTFSMSSLEGIYSKSLLVEKSTNPIKTTFWKIYKSSERHSISFFESALNVECLVEPVSLLEEYLAFVKPLNWNDEAQKVTEELKSLVHRHLNVVVDKHGQWNLDEWQNEFNRRERDANSPPPRVCSNCSRLGVSAATDPPKKKSRAVLWAWANLTPKDWESIFDSILLVASNNSVSFSQIFGPHKILLDQLARKSGYDWFNKGCVCRYCNPQQRVPCSRGCGIYTGWTTQKPSCCLKECWKPELKNGKLKPKDPTNAKFLVQVKVPDEFSNPKHFGHLAWKCCNLLKEA